MTDASFSSSDRDSVKFDPPLETGSRTCFRQAAEIDARKKADYKAMNDFYIRRPDCQWNRMFSLSFTADNVWKVFTQVLDVALSSFVSLANSQANRTKCGRFYGVIQRQCENSLRAINFYGGVYGRMQTMLNLHQQYQHTVQNRELRIENKHQLT
jgi:hypothetical protein